MKETLIKEITDTCVIQSKSPTKFIDIIITKIETEPFDPCYKFKIKSFNKTEEDNILEFSLEDKDKLIDLKNKIVNLVNQFE